MLCYNCMHDKGSALICPFCHTSAAPPSQPHQLLPGTLIAGRYTVGRVLGEGGFGITYIGRDNVLEKTVAIKEYFPHVCSQRNNAVSKKILVIHDKDAAFFQDGKESFLLEARNIARFSKESGIVNVSDFIEENDTAYIIMEYLEGITLKEYLQRYGVMTPQMALNTLTPIMETLEKLHMAGLIHRDISPDNIMCTNDGVKLMDFGAARYYDSDNKSFSLMLKHGYAPEEQYRRHGEQGPWTDIYALCATMYRCITGTVPPEAVERLANDKLKRPSEMGIAVSPQFENTLLYGLEVFSSNRCRSMNELLRLFREAPEVKPFPQSSVPQKTKKITLAVTAVIATVIVLAVAAVAALTFGQASNDHTEEAALATSAEQPTLAEDGTASLADGESADSTSESNITSDETVIHVTEPPISVADLDGELLVSEAYDIEYDSAGRMIKKTENDLLNHRYSTVTFEYDASDRMVKNVFFDADGSKTGWGEFSYDAKGQLIKYTYFESGGDPDYWYEYRYDDKGNQVEELLYDGDSSLKRRYQTEFGDDGRMLQTTRYNAADDSYIYIRNFVYDAQGNNTVSYGFDAEGNLIEWWESDYDAHSQQIAYRDYRVK